LQGIAHAPGFRVRPKKLTMREIKERLFQEEKERERMVDCEPDLMLLDIMMPKMNGYQLLQSIRRNAVFSELPVVVLSAKSSDRDREYAARLGANHFLAKPYRMEELIEVLQGIAHAPGFRVRPKKLTMREIKERLFQEEKERRE
ncbi:MAG: response regulator, partial [bacterium]|nr:response regulator [bacterium]